jgi:hypothetical protein
MFHDFGAESQLVVRMSGLLTGFFPERSFSKVDDRSPVNAVAILRWLAELGSLSGPCFWGALRGWAGCRSAELLVSGSAKLSSGSLAGSAVLARPSGPQAAVQMLNASHSTAAIPNFRS